MMGSLFRENDVLQVKLVVRTVVTHPTVDRQEALQPILDAGQFNDEVNSLAIKVTRVKRKLQFTGIVRTLIARQYLNSSIKMLSHGFQYIKTGLLQVRDYRQGTRGQVSVRFKQRNNLLMTAYNYPTPVHTTLML